MEEVLKLLLPPPSSSAKGGDLFTVTELSAAEQLVQLSGSTVDDSPFTSAATIAGEVEAAEDRSSSSSSSPRSVGTLPPDPGLFLFEDEEETGPCRMVHRYRALADLYAATANIDDPKEKKQQKKRKKNNDEPRRQRRKTEDER